ncbi:signal recognition particle protein [archaeon]|nr:signal recognition particle protein [archaeon]MBL7056843.1 signal recognition particle protein [Candidatus Woesearchaeota archaeon]
MVLDKLSDSLKNTLQKVTKAMFVDEKLVNELVKDIQRALLQSDVNVKLVFELTKKIKERALKEAEPSAISKKEQLVKIVYDELVEFLGGAGSKIEIKKKKPFKIMLVGLFGSGKTTLAGKLGKFYKTRGHKVAIIQTDTWRPAAHEQLKQLAEKAQVSFFGDAKEKDPVKIYKAHKKELSTFDIVIIDSAGRDALSDELIDELNKLNKEVEADENLLVISADIGQAAEKQAAAFHETCGVSGVVITKLDGTAKGGGALTACSVTGAHVKFIGVGEAINDIEEFKPEGFVGRLLGMGDIEALLEKAREAMTEEEAEDLGQRFLKGDYNLIDLYDQMKAMKKMGSMSKIMQMVPGMSQLKIPKEALQAQEGNIEKWRFVMDSMTKEELEDPTIMNGARVERVAKGAGLVASDVRSLLKQYKQSKKLVKMMKGGSEKNMDKMMQKMGGKMGMKF